MTEEPSKDEQKTERFNMFMSPSEMKAIEDWAWASRIRSKSEAIRRLCAIALICEDPIFTLSHGSHELLEQARLHHNAIVALQARVRKGEHIDAYNELEELSKGSASIHENLEIIQTVATSTGNETAEYLEPGQLEEAQKNAKDWRKKAANHLRRVERKHARRKK